MGIVSGMKCLPRAFITFFAIITHAHIMLTFATHPPRRDTSTMCDTGWAYLIYSAGLTHGSTPTCPNYKPTYRQVSHLKDFVDTTITF